MQEMIHQLNETGMASLDPQWVASAVSMNVAGGARPPLGVWFVF